MLVEVWALLRSRSLALLAGTPDESRPRDERRRRLHALYASALAGRSDIM